MTARKPHIRSTRSIVSTMLLGFTFLFGPVATDVNIAHAGVNKQLLRLHNKERKKRNRPRLRIHRALNRAAQQYSVLMAATGHFSHTGPSPEFSRFDQRIRAEGFRKSPIGENIARGQRTARTVMRAWTRSPGHRRNILNRRYRFAGFGRSFGTGGPYWVTDFGG